MTPWFCNILRALLDSKIAELFLLTYAIYYASTNSILIGVHKLKCVKYLCFKGINKIHDFNENY